MVCALNVDPTACQDLEGFDKQQASGNQLPDIKVEPLQDVSTTAPPN